MLLLLPLSAFFSAVCLAIGAYARSTKEGQYYLMPLFLVTMPLIFLTLAPGVELNSFYSMVPVTGVALLMQRLMTAAPLQQPWFYFVPVMAPIAPLQLAGAALGHRPVPARGSAVPRGGAARLGLVAAAAVPRKRDPADHRTGPVLFRLFCSGCVGCRKVWARTCRSWSERHHRGCVCCRPAVVHGAAVDDQAAASVWRCVGRPGRTWRRRCSWCRSWISPASRSTAFRACWAFLQERQMLVERVFLRHAKTTAWSIASLVLALVTAAGKELAFRGFIFAGLLMRMRPWPAILVSSFLFAAFHMNVFLLPPFFLLGIALGILALRSGSLLPGIILHASCYAVVQFGPPWLGGAAPGASANPLGGWPAAVTAVCTLAAAALLWWQNRRSGSGLVEALLGLPQPVIPPTSEPHLGAERLPVAAAKQT